MYRDRGRRGNRTDGVNICLAERRTGLIGINVRQPDIRILGKLNHARNGIDIDTGRLAAQITEIDPVHEILRDRDIEHLDPRADLEDMKIRRRVTLHRERVIGKPHDDRAVIPKGNMTSIRSAQNQILVIMGRRDIRARIKADNFIGEGDISIREGDT